MNAKNDSFAVRDEQIQNADYRAYFDSEILRVWHLDGKKITVRIVRVTRFTSDVYDSATRTRKKQTQPKLVLETRGGRALELPLLLNKTNSKTIAQLYGRKPDGWIGRLITLYPTTAEVGGEIKDAIRIEPTIPAERTERKGPGRENRQGVNIIDTKALPPERVQVTDAEFSAREPGDDSDEPPFGALSGDGFAPVEVDNVIR